MKNRNHVHLSIDIETAINVAARYGKPVLLIIKSAKMYKSGYDFYESVNKVWLTKGVKPEYIEFPEK